MIMILNVLHFKIKKSSIEQTKKIDGADQPLSKLLGTN